MKGLGCPALADLVIGRMPEGLVAAVDGAQSSGTILASGRCVFSAFALVTAYSSQQVSSEIQGDK